LVGGDKEDHGTSLVPCTHALCNSQQPPFGGRKLIRIISASSQLSDKEKDRRAMHGLCDLNSLQILSVPQFQSL